MVALLTFLAGPIGRWLLILTISAAAVAGAYYRVKSLGWEERDAIAQKEEKERERLAAVLATKQVAVTERVVTKYITRTKEIQVKGEEVIREVEKLVPSGSCDLPGGWRVLHDAAAQGSLPETASGDAAAPVPAATAATTVAQNYAICRLDQERLRALQEWVLEQENLNGHD